jgi:adenylate cyclase
MAEARAQRRLAAILAADVAGYSRLIHADEAGTLAAMRAIWTDRFNPAVDAYRGRIVKVMGDGALVEFASAVDAVECAVALQGAMSGREQSRPGTAPIEFRIGVNIGDIVIEGGDIFGDGVNVAARLQEHAPRGGLLISDSVHAQVKGKTDAAFTDAGELNLKNIDTPVRAWCWVADPATGRVQESELPAQSEIPSIAVLPFTSMSADPEQEFFADGLVDDIITSLSKLAGLRVIARNSSFIFKGRAVDVREAAKQLGVRYVLEGSVRKSANRIRITAQLIDAVTGSHVWAERYDRAIDDIFSVQDEITLVLATELQVRLTEGEQARLRYTTTRDFEAWTYWTQGLSHYRQAIAKESSAAALACWERALALDPASAALNAMIGLQHVGDARFGWWDDRETALGKARGYAARALELDPGNADAHIASGFISLMQQRYDEAVAHVRRAIQSAPSSADAASYACFILACSGHAKEAVTQGEKSMLLSPNYPPYYLGVLGNAYRLSGRIEEAISAFRAFHDRSPGFGLSDLVIIYQQIGQGQEAKRMAERLLSVRRDFTITAWASTQFRSDEAQLEADIAALRAAGLPMN